MSFLPIVERELRERARWRSTYWVRGTVAFLATGIAAFVLMFVSAATPGAVGKVTLQILGWLAFPFLVLEGLRNTADSLSAEKREGTLGLLFLTDLKGYDVVLGKFIASSLTSFFAALAMVPALAIPVLLGGVTGAEFWRLVLALMNTLFFSLTVGMLVSSISRDERRAWVGTFLVIFLFVVVMPALAASLKVPWLASASPFTAFWHHGDTRYTAAPEDYWRSLLIPHLISWVWLTLASVLLPRVWQDGGARKSRPRAATSAYAARSRLEMLALNPIWWLTSRNTHQRNWLWVVVVAALLCGVPVWLALQGSGDVMIVYGCFVFFHLVIAVWVASEACNSFAEARSTGAMELLLSTPLKVRDILRGQHLALRELFVGPVILLLVGEVGMAVGQIWLMAQQGQSALCFVVALALGFSIVWFVLDLFAVAEVGMWFALTSQKPTQALTKTVLCVLILPMLILPIPCCLGIAPGLMVAKSIIFFTWAQSRLENEFRRAATQRYDAPRTRKWLRGGPPPLRMPGDPPPAPPRL